MPRITGLRHAEGMSSFTAGYEALARRLEEAERREARLEEELAHARRVDSLGYMTVNVVHDVNNLLTPILCLSGILARDLGVETPAGQTAAEVEALAERTATLLRQLLGFVRRGPDRAANVAVGALLRGMQPLLEILVGRSVELRLAVEEGTSEVRVSAGRFEQAILNLVANARDAMPSGGVLTLRTAEVERAIDGVKRRCVAIVVADTGVGMSDEARVRAFEETFTTKERGTGIGLFSVQRFVQDAGGTVDLVSREGEGTSITLFFPRVEGAGITCFTRSGASPCAARGETILVVDDDEGVRRGARAVLEAAGHVVFDAPLHEATTRARSIRGPLHLLLADLSPGKVDVGALVEGVRVVHPQVAILRMSGGVNEVPSTLAFPVLRKAFSGEELVRRTREVLDGQRCAP